MSVQRVAEPKGGVRVGRSEQRGEAVLETASWLRSELPDIWGTADPCARQRAAQWLLEWRDRYEASLQMVPRVVLVQPAPSLTDAAFAPEPPPDRLVEVLGTVAAIAGRCVGIVLRCWGAVRRWIVAGWSA
jgi:hypothetical protein